MRLHAAEARGELEGGYLQAKAHEQLRRVVERLEANVAALERAIWLQRPMTQIFPPCSTLAPSPGPVWPRRNSAK